MPTITESRFRAAERLAFAQRRRLMLALVQPEPPRGVRFSNGTVTWEAPKELRNVTHYNVYADSEARLERRVPKGQTKATAVYADRVLVSSFNEATGFESRKVAAAGAALTGPAGTEYAPMVSSFSASAVDKEGESGTQLFWFEGTVGLPSVTGSYGGCDIVGTIDGLPGLVLIARLTATETAFKGVMLPKTGADQAWVLYALSRDTAGNRNTIVGSTPKVNITVAKGSPSLDGGRLDPATYDTVELEVVGGVFKVKQVNLKKAFNFNAAEFEIDATDGYRVKALIADKIRTGILSVGNIAGGQVSKAAFFNSTGQVYGFIGDDSAGSGFQGAAFHELRAGDLLNSAGTFDINRAKVIFSANGDFTMKGGDIYLGPGTDGKGGQMFLMGDSGPIGYLGTADAASPVNVTSVVAGLLTSAANHNLTVGKYFKLKNTSNPDHNRTFKVATTPTATTLTATGLSGNSTGGTLTEQLLGGWLQELRIGGSDIASANIVATGGSLTITDATFSLTLSGVTTEIKNQTVTGFGSEPAGIYVSRASNNTQAMLFSTGLHFGINGVPYGKLVADTGGPSAGGVLNLNNTSGVATIYGVGSTGLLSATTFGAGDNLYNANGFYAKVGASTYARLYADAGGPSAGGVLLLYSTAGAATIQGSGETGILSCTSLSVTDAPTTRSNLGLGSMALQSTGVNATKNFSYITSVTAGTLNYKGWDGLNYSTPIITAMSYSSGSLVATSGVVTT